MVRKFLFSIFVPLSIMLNSCGAKKSVESLNMSEDVHSVSLDSSMLKFVRAKEIKLTIEDISIDSAYMGALFESPCARIRSPTKGIKIAHIEAKICSEDTLESESISVRYSDEHGSVSEQKCQENGSKFFVYRFIIILAFSTILLSVIYAKRR